MLKALIGNPRHALGTYRRRSEAALGDLSAGNVWYYSMANIITAFLVCATAFVSTGGGVTALSQGRDLYPAKQGGKWGYIDRAGRIVIPPQFDYAWDFSDGLGPVEVGLKKGYVDTEGGVVIKPQFRNALTFSEGLAAVLADGRWVYIDRSGKVVLTPSYCEGEPEEDSDVADGGPYIDSFSDGLAHIATCEGNGAVYINKSGAVAIKADVELSNRFSEGLAAVRIGGKWGYMDTVGRIVIQAQYDRASD